uniref:Putative secreted protein n=1 Tax=Anopheles darlingi TaxID=43151 RepID=A0A2M4DFH2_ANODA
MQIAVVVVMMVVMMMVQLQQTFLHRYHGTTTTTTAAMARQRYWCADRPWHYITPRSPNGGCRSSWHRHAAAVPGLCIRLILAQATTRCGSACRGRTTTGRTTGAHLHVPAASNTAHRLLLRLRRRRAVE